ncbi:hypothetical protein ACWDZ8_29695 [Streptomyces sp. NPDC003233]
MVDAEPDALTLASVPAEPEDIPVRTGVPHVPRADREQGVPQPEHRVDACPRHGRAEPDELCSGVFVALFSPADLLGRSRGSAWVRRFLSVLGSEPARQSAVLAGAGSGFPAAASRPTLAGLPCQAFASDL